MTWYSKAAGNVTIVLKMYFVSELFDGKRYLFGFEVVLFEWEEGLLGSDSPIREGIVTLNKSNRAGFIILAVIHPSGRKYLLLPSIDQLFFPMFTETKQRHKIQTRHFF